MLETKLPYIDTMCTKEVAELTGKDRKVLCNPASRFRSAYLGRGLFKKSEVLNIIATREAREWLRSEVQLFVEYLNKIEKIPYTHISKKIGISYTNHFSTLDFSYNTAVKILVKYRKYTKKYEEYYYG